MFVGYAVPVKQVLRKGENLLHVTIAVVGPLANTRSNMPGTWSVAAVLDNAPSLVEGLTVFTGIFYPLSFEFCHPGTGTFTFARMEIRIQYGEETSVFIQHFVSIFVIYYINANFEML